MYSLSHISSLFPERIWWVSVLYCGVFLGRTSDKKILRLVDYYCQKTTTFGTYYRTVPALQLADAMRFDKIL